MGWKGKDNLSFVNAVLWALHSGARWEEVPERYSKHKTVPKRFKLWARLGTWERMFAAPVADQKDGYRVIDSIQVRAHQRAATGRKKGTRTSPAA